MYHRGTEIYCSNRWTINPWNWNQTVAGIIQTSTIVSRQRHPCNPRERVQASPQESEVKTHAIIEQSRKTQSVTLVSYQFLTWAPIKQLNIWTFMYHHDQDCPDNLISDIIRWQRTKYNDKSMSIQKEHDNKQITRTI